MNLKKIMMKEPKPIFTAVDVIQAGNHGLVFGIFIGIIPGIIFGMMIASFL